ncbi:MAG: hypothetical protein K8H88_06530, partial [Sandaracinaceae bacterium]|nr:hypothetical protein [Sandaracinaceae bacterium]
MNNDANRGEHPVPPGAGYVRRLTLPYSSAIAPVYDFLVAPPAPLPSGQRPAGGYRVVAPIVLGDPMSLPLGETRCGKFEPEPKASETFDDAQEETPTTPSLPSKTCSGLENVRIPLETELTDDGDRYETSWRTQLRTALAAAELADRLGEEMISAGLDVDRRAEEAQSAIEQACGVTVNLGPIFNDNGTPLQANGGPCQPGDTCGTGYQCVGGVCLISAVERALSLAEAGSREHRVLAECLGAGDQAPVDLVSLGTDDLCVWRRTNDPNYVCEPLAGGPRCPYEPRPLERNPDGSVIPATLLARCQRTDLQPPSGVALETVPVLRSMRFFGQEPGGTGTGVPDPSALDCRTIRWQQSPTHRSTDHFEAVVNSNLFALNNLKKVVRRIGWRGQPGDYSEATIDREVWFTTGSPWVIDPNLRPSTGWPCAEHATSGAECTDGADGLGLFCSHVACTDRVARAQLNQRLAQAFMFLGVSTAYGLGNLHLPMVHPGRDHAYRPGSESSNALWYYHATNLTEGEQLVAWPDARYGDGRFDFGGSLYEPGGGLPEPRHIWTSFAPNNFGVPGPAPGIPGSCPENGCPIYLTTPGNQSSDYWRYSHFAFANYGSQVPDTDMPHRLAQEIWSGMQAGSSPQGEGLGRATRFGPLVYRTIEAEGLEPGDLVLNGQSAWIHHLTNAFTSPVFEQETDVAQRPNVARVSTYGFTRQNILDALEIVCEAQRQWGNQFNCDGSDPPELRSPSDLPAVQAHILCLAERVESMGERVVLQNVPAPVVEGLDGTSAATRPIEGNFGQAVHGARTDLLQLKELPSALATQLRQFEIDIELMRTMVQILGIQSEIIDLEFASQALSAASTCGGALVGAFTGSAGGLAACGTAAAQLGLSFQIRENQLSRLNLEQQQALLQLRQRMNERVEAFGRIETQIQTLTESLRTHLNGIQSSQSTARRALSRAMFVGSTEGREHLNEAPIASEVNTVLRRRYGTAQVRYRAAHTRAIRAAELARRAVEQRLGIEMSNLTRDMALVDAPSRWANLVCGMQGLNYARIRNEQTPAGGTGETTSYDNYAAEYVGDYVRNLQAVYDSYEYDFPYTDASDTAVVSLRDDVWNVRAPCSTPVYNLLPSTGDLLGVRDGDLLWRNYDCVDPAPAGAAGCITSPRRLEVGEAPTSPLPPTPGRDVPVGYRFTFNQGWTVAGQPLSLNPNSMFAHELEVQPGTYRVSWYGRPGTAAPAPDAVIRVVAVTGSVSVDETGTVTDTQNIQQGTWERFSFTFDVLQPTTVRIGVYPNLTAPTAVHHVDIAGLMLEDVSRDLDATTPPRD